MATTKERITEIAHVSEKAWQAAQKMAASIAQLSPPVPLEKLAEQVGIRHVRFVPLIGDAGIGKSGSNFDIVVNVDTFRDVPTAGTILELGDPRWAEFTTPLRRTIAHEIAHLLFLNAAGKKQDSDLFRKNERAVENGCNVLARVLLIPPQMLLREASDRLFDLDHLKNLTAAFKVSTEVLIRRLHLSDMRMEEWKVDGFIAYVKEQEGLLRVMASHVMGGYALRRFNLALEKKESPPQHMSLSDSYKQVKWAMDRVTDDKHMPLSNIALGRDHTSNTEIESKLRSTQRGEFDLDVAYHDDDVIPCKLAFIRLHDPPLGFLLRLYVAGPPQKRGQKQLF